MSWLVRALIREYRRIYGEPPIVKRPRKLVGYHVRFCLKLYGEKQELVTYARSRGGEFSAFVREVLDLWMRGKLKPDLESVQTVKRVRKFQISLKRVAYPTLKKVDFYQKDEYWPKNRWNNIWLMDLGINSRSGG